MKKFKKVILFLMFALTVYYLVSRIPAEPGDKYDIKVLFLYNKIHSDSHSYVLDAYRSVMQEEGVPVKFSAPAFVLPKEPEEVARIYPVIVMADGIARSMPTDLRFWMKEYMEKGGNLAVIFDAGTKDLRDNYRDDAIFNQLAGVDYLLYNKLPDPNDSNTTAYIRFRDRAAADYLGIPPGKFDEKFFISGYSYGQLIFPIARVKTLDGDPPSKEEIYAYAETDAGEVYPLVVLRKVYQGNLLYVNLPLGHLKAYANDLLVRCIMRTFLFKVAKFPHLMNTPYGKGGLVINWHIDWSEDWEGLEFMRANGYFTPHIKYSIHNTAGPFTDKPGDGVGFDACGKGRPFLTPVLKYGTLGSHGGWAHNWFYRNILDGTFGEKEIEQYIVKNNRCLRSISGYPVTEYSAPNGVHPQPLLTDILERNGIIAYYYTGDCGSAPNRTFSNRRMVSPKVIAFPVLSYRQNASFFEMKRDGVPPEAFQQWGLDLVDYLIQNRTVRLIYSHSYDVPPYFPREFKRIIHRVEEAAGQGQLLAQPMSYFARFMRRFLKTTYRFTAIETGMRIRVANPGGLHGIVVAVPVQNYKKPEFKRNDIHVGQDDNYYYLTFKEGANEKTIHIAYASR